LNCKYRRLRLADRIVAILSVLAGPRQQRTPFCPTNERARQASSSSGKNEHFWVTTGCSVRGPHKVVTQKRVEFQHTKTFRKVTPILLTFFVAMTDRKHESDGFECCARRPSDDHKIKCRKSEGFARLP
jgi:hypothetical protein